MSSELQQRSLLARRIATAMATPIVLLVVLALVLGRQILEMSESARWVDHSDQVLGVANETLREIIDQQASFRGYLLTDDRAFLEPLDHARPMEGFARLHDLVSDNPEQQARFDQARERYGLWFAATSAVLRSDGIQAARTLDAIGDRRAQMDRVREAMREGTDVEDGLRGKRAIASLAAVATTKSVFMALFAGFAALLAFLSRRQLNAIARTFGAAVAAEKTAREAKEREEWIRTGQAKLAGALQGERTIQELGRECLEVIGAYTHADVGAFFTKEAGEWRRRAGHALDSTAAGLATFAVGEGIIGRVAADGKLLDLHDVPREFLKVRSGTGEMSPVEIVVIPACVDGATNAVLEFGFLRAADARTIEMLGRVGDSVAVAVRSSDYKQQLRELLEEAQQHAEEVQTQQEELRVTNEELEAQTTALRTTHRQLETQQAELEQTNDHLVEQATLLERKNLELADQEAEVASKAREIERASQFKSDFLSNMSHELRTPLNSSLILAKLLADNKDGNLTEEQVKFAATIYGAGNDLLTLINDILDLSKIESGKMDVAPTSVPLERMRAALMRTFEPVATDKGIRFEVTLASTAPVALDTDAQRLEQILKNLVSNALKFTSRGAVVVEMASSGDRVTFAVRDTGIGIAKGQQRMIFEAFRQADGTTNRRFGGTGLGLSISRELARLLGGDISLTSDAGKGSTFTLSLPQTYAGPLAIGPALAHATESLAVARSSAPSDLAPASVGAEEPADLELGRRVVVVIEDDETFAQVLTEVAREAGFQCVVAATAERGLRLAKKLGPTGVILDMKLPDHSGLTVLDRLKRDPVTRHIPVHVISGSDETERALSMGAATYLQKPVSRERLVEAFRALESRSSHRVRHVLVVEDDATLRDSVAKLLERSDVEVSTAASVDGALALLRERTFDCVVTDLGLPDHNGYDLLEKMAIEAPYSVPPVIVYTGRALTADDEHRLRKYSKAIIIKGARSPERLLDEVTLFLHQVESELPPHQQRLLAETRHREAVFEKRTILVVEDDVRNLFALTSVLEPKGARVAIARNGKEALAALAKEPHVDLVLMDIMMPEMDGLEATREIRKNPRWAKLPVIALTAKAMKDDQERCMAAGASDYVAKPLDVEMLLSLLRVWMPKS